MLGEQLKADALNGLEIDHVGFIEFMRSVAQEICRQGVTVTIDDLRQYAREQGIEPDHQNVWGAIFRGSNWVEVGRVKSSLATNHAREIRVWQFNG